MAEDQKSLENALSSAVNGLVEQLKQIGLPVKITITVNFYLENNKPEIVDARQQFQKYKQVPAMPAHPVKEEQENTEIDTENFYSLLQAWARKLEMMFSEEEQFLLPQRQPKA